MANGILFDEPEIETVKGQAYSKLGKIVCPICLRAECSLYRRLLDKKFSDDERRCNMALYHRTVCERCKCLMVAPPCKRDRWIENPNGKGGRWHQCHELPPKSLGDNRLPDWWVL